MTHTDMPTTNGFHVYGEQTPSHRSSKSITKENLNSWGQIAHYWDNTVAEGNDMYRELVLPSMKELVNLVPGERVLDIATGNGIIARQMATLGGKVTATDGCGPLLEIAKERTNALGEICPPIEFTQVDATCVEELDRLAKENPGGFDIITMSMAITDLITLEPLANALPKLLKPYTGRFVTITLHPVLSKPGTSRLMEVVENPLTGALETHRAIKVSKYLHIPPIKSEAIRGQPFPQEMIFHRPLHEIFLPFFKAGMVMDGLKEPVFEDGKDPEQLQSYHNFPQHPMLLAFRLRFGASASL